MSQHIELITESLLKARVAKGFRFPMARVRFPPPSMRRPSVVNQKVISSLFQPLHQASIRTLNRPSLDRVHVGVRPVSGADHLHCGLEIPRRRSQSLGLGDSWLVEKSSLQKTSFKSVSQNPDVIISNSFSETYATIRCSS